MCCILPACFKKLIECLTCEKRLSALPGANNKGANEPGLGGEGDEMENQNTSFTISSSSSSSSSIEQQELVIHSKAWSDLPVAMKNPQGVFINDTLYLGGGFTGTSKTDTAIYSYNFTSDLGSWISMPPPPELLKWSALATFRNKLILVGGKESGKTRQKVYTNRVAVWDVRTQKWDSSIPPMNVPRMSPVVINHGGYLIVAGGKKGLLDYQAEVLDTTTTPMRWVCSPALPLPCYRHTSTVAGSVWYLVDQSKGDILYIDIGVYVKQTFPLTGVHTPSDKSTHGSATCGWKKLANSPPVIPFKILSLNSQPVAFSDDHGKLALHMLQEDGTWSEVTGHQLPLTLNSALVLSSEVDRGVLLVLGGENSQGYSDKAYKLSLITEAELKEIKKSKCTRITISHL